MYLLMFCTCQFDLGEFVVVVFVVAGIGRATCAAIAKHGGQVIALSRTQSDLDSLKEEVKATPILAMTKKIK